MSTNISKQKRDDLIAKIKAIRTYIASAPQDENTGALLTYLSELEKEVKLKKYGLVFEEHRESIDEKLATHTPVLVEENELFIDNGGQLHFLIEGDNLAALQLLLKTHREKIDLIYIDPPYNTGNKDFIYDDSRVDRNDGYQHSKWLSFMEKRLALAKELLSSHGLIFISIDDNEQANLKLLCTKIFGEESFRGQITRATGTPTGQGNETLVNESDYIIVFSKSKNAIIKGLIFTEKDAKIYNLEDEKGKYLIRPLRKTGGEDRREDRPSMYYPIIDPDGNEVYPIAPTGYESRWRCAEQRFSQLSIDKMIEWKQIKGVWKVYQKFYLEGRTKQAGNLWLDVEGNKKATITIKNIFGKNVFDFSKPVGLIERIVQIGSNSSSIILDFFAGSGTTGHAVMKLNAENCENRRYILCTNNENNICREVNYERLKRVIEREDYKDCLKYYRIDFVPISEKVYYEYADELLLHVRELVELENGVNFTGNAEIAIVLTDHEMEDFIADVDKGTVCKRLYRGHDILLTAEQTEILQNHNVTVCIIPDYYYRDLEGGQ